jgi:septal ring factor EnvC (AmiA/AmiB activator)
MGGPRHERARFSWRRHGRACPGHPDHMALPCPVIGVAGTSPAMTMRESIPFRHALGFLAATLSLTAAVPALVPSAAAQDVPGIELCTRERQMDRRTGCLQSNVEYLLQLIAKNSLDAQQRLAAANREIATQRDQLAAANKEIAALKDALAELKTRADQAPAAVAARELATLRDAVRDLRARVDDAQKAKPK